MKSNKKSGGAKQCTAKKGDYPCTIFGCPWCIECALYKFVKKPKNENIHN